MDRAGYDEDIYAWAFEQAAALRRIAETRRDLPNELDLENVAEEIEGVARSELSRAESFLRLLLLHLIKVASAPEARSVGHWRAEIKVLHAEVAETATQSIVQRMKLDRKWRLALDQAEAQLELEGDVLAEDIPIACPLTIEELVTEPFDIESAVRRLRPHLQQLG